MKKAATHHELGVLYLGETGQKALLGRVIRALGFEFRAEPEMRGLSGLRHRNVWLGLNEASRHAVVIQHGMERAYREHARVPKGQEKDELISIIAREASLPIRTKEDFVRRDVIFAGLDIQGLLKHEGYSTDLLFFQNVASWDAFGVRDFDWKTGAFVPSGESARLPKGLGGTHHWSVEPLVRISRAELSENAFGLGACFLALDDFTPEQVARLTEDASEATDEMMLGILKRLRVAQYFSPPVDELILGAASLEAKFTRDSLPALATLSAVLKHPVGPPAILAGIDSADPRAVAEALADDRKIAYRGSVAYTTAEGLQVTHEFANRPQESWIRKLTGVGGFLGEIQAVIKAFIPGAG